MVVKESREVERKNVEKIAELWMVVKVYGEG